MKNIWWDGHDSRTRAYFFWKWEYDRRNKTYQSEYISALETGKPSPEHFQKVYKHEHFDPAQGQDSFEILAAALMSSKPCPFEPYPPDGLFLDETGRDGHHNEKECIAFIISEEGLFFRLNPNLDLATHRTVLEDNFHDMIAQQKLFSGSTQQRIIPLSALRNLYVPNGYRQKDNHKNRAIGLMLYDVTSQGTSFIDAVKQLESCIQEFSFAVCDENTLRRYLRATQTCVEAHEVLPLAPCSTKKVKNLF